MAKEYMYLFADTKPIWCDRIYLDNQSLRTNQLVILKIIITLNYES